MLDPKAWWPHHPNIGQRPHMTLKLQEVRWKDFLFQMKAGVCICVHFFCEHVGVSYSEKLLEMRAVVESRYVCGKQKHRLGSLPPLLNHSLIEPS